MSCLNLTRSIRGTLAGKTILLTGSTGFLAKVFLEKIIRTSPEINKIYLLIRGTASQSPGARAEVNVFASDIFDYCKADMGPRFKDWVQQKVSIVRGDTSLRRLGLADGDYLTLSSEVDFIVNAAACTDFMNPLDQAVLTNALSTKNLAEMILGSKKARLLHVSTCYVNEMYGGVVKEEFLPSAKQTARTENIDSLIRELESIVTGSACRDLVEEGFRAARSFGWNNIYTFTKWIGERILNRERDKIFAAIIRPSIVESCAHEPVAGWIEGFKVGDPLFAAAGKNKLIFLPAKKDAIIDIIPVDVVANAMFVGLFELGRREEPGVQVYQVAGGSENPATIETLRRILPGSMVPSKKARPIFVMPPFIWSAITFAVNVSGAGRLLGAPWKKVADVFRIYAPYTGMKTVFDNANLRAVHAQLSAEEQKDFPVSIKDLDWKKYLLDVHVPGLKRHVFKETNSLLRRAQ